jgi:cytoskeletal protein CcmA (bactofilin family)
MFNKRSEESEWTRFSKAFTGKEGAKGDDPAREGEDVAETNGVTGETAAEVVTATPALTSAATRPVGADTNYSMTPRPTVPTVATRPSASADVSEDVESTIGEHASFNGTYRSEHSIRIKGSAQGEIECQRSVYVEEKAKVEAKVTAATITVAGEVNGELNCTGRVEIRPSGRVTGTINAATLVMQEGAFFDGNLRMKQSGSDASTSA